LDKKQSDLIKAQDEIAELKAIIEAMKKWRFVDAILRHALAKSLSAAVHKALKYSA
jgi:hypothetical protein